MVLGRLETQHGATCLTATASPFSTFDSQLLSFHILINSASLTLLDSHTSQEPQIYIKTMGFKPFRDTYLQSAISQTLWNHILPKTGGGGRGQGQKKGARQSNKAVYQLSTLNCQLSTIRHAAVECPRL